MNAASVRSVWANYAQTAELERELEQRLETEQQAERLGEEQLWLRRELGQPAEELEQLRAQEREGKQEEVELEQEMQQEQKGWEYVGHAPKHAELGEDQHSVRGCQEQPREVRQESSPPSEE
jgi:hypothetical protein